MAVRLVGMYGCYYTYCIAPLCYFSSASIARLQPSLMTARFSLCAAVMMLIMTFSPVTLLMSCAWPSSADLLPAASCWPGANCHKIPPSIQAAGPACSAELISHQSLQIKGMYNL